MTTFSDLCSTIANEVDDTTEEYAGDIKNSVLAAIRFCDRTVYYFNETRDITFPTVQGQQWYGAADNANIPTLVRIVSAWKEDVQGMRTLLERVPPSVIETVADSAASQGEPYEWTYFAQQIRLYPIPSSNPYTIRLQVSPYRLATLVNPNDTNAWLDEALDLVKARAKYILYKDVIKDPALAAEALNDWSTWDNAKTAETSARNGTGRIRPTEF